jgi:hypothetical protein
MYYDEKMNKIKFFSYYGDWEFVLRDFRILLSGRQVSEKI